MKPAVSIVIPAYREAGRIGVTVVAVRRALAATSLEASEVLVVDDGSPDATGAEAEAAGARVLRLPRNRGKGGALAAGFAAATGDVLVMLDADLRDTAAEVTRLIDPVLRGEADMTIALFTTPAGHQGGFGLVKRLAAWGLRRVGVSPLRAPLSGQRAMTREAWRRLGKLDPGFGLEMGLNLDAAFAGLRLLEVPTSMAHRLTGRDWSGFVHRGRQLRDVAAAIARRWNQRHPRRQPE